MNRTIKLEVVVCCDEHGNYQAVGTSAPNLTMGQKVSMVEDGIVTKEYNHTTTTFKVNFNLPEPKEKENAEK